jgi:NitT/TauT family transport system ATP-binding protein
VNASIATTGAAAEQSGAAIAGRAITKHFPAREHIVTALEDISFSIRGGEFVSLIGPSGCGKSTLMLICAGLIPASSGEVVVAGKHLDRPLTDVGIVFQDHLLLEFRSALDNVLLQPQVRRQPLHSARIAAVALLRRLDIEHAAERYP